MTCPRLSFILISDVERETLRKQSFLNVRAEELTKCLIPFIILLFLFATPVFAALDTAHVGFVDTSIWFDREPFFSGENVRIYTALANSTPADFTGTVEFYDSESLIGSREVSLERNGGFEVVWTDWTTDGGDRRISVKIVDATLTLPGGEPEPVLYEEAPSYALERFVDTDTDGDGVGNRDDDDDDNDGILDPDDTEPLLASLSSGNERDETDTGKKEGISLLSRLERLSGEAVEAVGGVASSTVPKITAGIEKAVETIEAFRVNQNVQIDERIKAVERKIAEDRGGFEGLPQGEGERKTSPWNQLELLALTAAGYAFSGRIAFYVLGAFVAYIILKTIVPWIYRMIFG